WVALAVVFVPGVIALAQRWASAEYFQHGFLVPVVSLAAAHPRIRGLGPSERHGRALAGLAGAPAGDARGLVAGGGAVCGRGAGGRRAGRGDRRDGGLSLGRERTAQARVSARVPAVHGAAARTDRVAGRDLAADARERGRGGGVARARRRGAARRERNAPARWR